MARLAVALAGLMSADRGRRNRDRPEGVLRALSAYLIGFSIVRTGANAYVHLGTLGRLLPQDESYTLAILSTIAACAPLAAGILLSGGRIDAERRLAMLPVPGRTRLAIAALGPAVAALPILMLASALPLLAALPIATYSLIDYLKVGSWYPLACMALALGLRSLFGAILRSLGKWLKMGGESERRVALAVALAVSAMANPRPMITDGRGFLALFSSTSITADVGIRLALPLARPVEALLVLGVMIVFAASAAVLEDIASRALPVDRVRRTGTTFSRAPIMLLVADAERRVGPGLGVSLALAAIALFQGAAPGIPLAFAAVAIVVRIGAATAFLATEGAATRRFALIPAGPGTVDRAFLAAATLAALLVAAPLFAAGLVLALES